jgi:hypothetical protein
MNNIFHWKSWFLKHSEEIGGSCLAMMYKLLGGSFSLANVDFTRILERLITEAPSMFLAGFMGGLGGLSVRFIFSLLSKKKIDE